MSETIEQGTGPIYCKMCGALIERDLPINRVPVFVCQQCEPRHQELVTLLYKGKGNERLQALDELNRYNVRTGEMERKTR